MSVIPQKNDKNKNITHWDWIKATISAFLLFILLSYYVGNKANLLLVAFFSFLASWITLQDVKGFIINDKLLIVIFGVLSFGLSNYSIFEYAVTAFYIFSFITIIDYLSTGYRFGEIRNADNLVKENENKIEKLYYGTAGYIIGWTQSTIILLLVYMFFPVERNFYLQSVVNGWKVFIEFPILHLLFCVILGFALFKEFRKKKKFEKDYYDLIYYKNIRPHTAWFLAFFGALLGMPVTIAVMIFSFILYIPAYCLWYCKVNHSGRWIKEATVKLYTFKIKK